MVETRVYVYERLRGVSRWVLLMRDIQLPFLVQEGSKFAFVNNEPNGPFTVKSTEFRVCGSMAVAWLDEFINDSEAALQDSVKFWKARGFVIADEK
jgi:ribosome biogenesis SPOUT family RNA methylase Rps3